MKHILVLPFPLSGHVIPMLNLCCKLASRGIGQITLLINEDCVETVEKLHKELVARGDLSKEVVFTVESIPVTWPPAFRGSAEQIECLSRAIDGTGKFAEEVAIRALQSTSVPPVSFLLSDFGLWWSQDLANKLGVPRILLSIIGFQEFGIILQMPRLISQGIYNPFTETQDDDLENKLIEVPGFPAFRASEIPRISQIPDALKCYWDALLRYMTRAREAKLILVNSCYELEGEAYDATLRIHKLPIHLAGPLLASPLDSIATSDCLKWLDTIRSPRSVLFSSFGTYLQLPSSELEEILFGIEASGQSFLLAFRTDVVVGDPSPTLLSFLDRYKEPQSDPRSKQRGLIVPWAPQREVLLHGSVGGFFTHFGWNSVLESLAAGVPMIGKPIVGDQVGNRRLAVDRWKVALEIPEDDEKKLRKEAVEATVRELFSNEKLRANAARLGKSLEEIVQENGCAYKCWDMVAKI
ncbi:hypothetical protein SELMODRAFT_165329 [Selaginella moellendorffii]|uniref:Glycosyltransferase n=1 Tax=Selaginella moellendorffii TaxID=88036 RepID=D8QU40_SELML|nr:UDP-glycosyltransferase 85A7 [Selaginella moellendorffii]EFJ36233.1 hypothetical protein SELMODRAFT_165329 [Selaginella moellendorffii]|eukprot:XP_002962770.1 UDP-glycosyltransferase 85A7 [Selaginella moellendorffii]